MSTTEKQTLDEFKNIKNELEKWGKFIDDKLVNEVLKKHCEDYRIKIYPKFRIKDEHSYLSKALRRGKDYANPILEIEDKIGTRVVFLLSDDVRQAEKLIVDSELWNAKITKVYDDIAKESPEKFGYQSVHIVVWPKEQCDFVSDINLLTCEIQIRTLLQHAYSELSHDSTYKGPFKNDKEILRKLSKSMALMEATDDYFCLINEMINDVNRKNNNLSIELTNLYKTFVPNFNDKEIDKPMTEEFFVLFDKIQEDNDVFISIEDIKSTITKKSDNIQYVITNKKYYLATQPLFLLAVHFLFNYKKSLENEWPLNAISLEEFKRSFGL